MKRAWIVLIALMPLATLAGCSDGNATRTAIAGMSAAVAQAAAAATGQEAIFAEEVASGSHLGFDTGTYPGDKAMRAWREGGSPYVWTGYYLPSPCHRDDGWSGKRALLTDMGYGLAVIYVGQQTWGRMPGAPHFISVPVQARVKTRVGKGGNRRTVWKTVTRMTKRRAPAPAPDATCNADFVHGSRGMADGVDAAQRAHRHDGVPRSRADGRYAARHARLLQIVGARST